MRSCKKIDLQCHGKAESLRVLFYLIIVRLRNKFLGRYVKYFYAGKQNVSFHITLYTLLTKLLRVFNYNHRNCLLKICFFVTLF